MAFDLDALLKKLISNHRISSRLHELQVQREEVEMILPALIAMYEEDSDLAQQRNDYVTTIIREETGVLVAVKELSDHGRKHFFLQRIVTQNIYPWDFEDDKVYERIAERKEVIAAFSTFITSMLEGAKTKGLYIYGEARIGKTFSFKRFAKKLAEQGFTVAIMPLTGILSLIKGNFADKTEIVNVLKGADILMLDDIGAETIVPWFRDEILVDLLTVRLAQNKPVFFTSSFSYAKLEEIEARTTGEKFRDVDKARRLLGQIRALTIPIHLHGKVWN